MNIYRKLTLLKIDILLLLIFISTFILLGAPLTGYSWINSSIFIIISVIKLLKIKIRTEVNFFISLGRILSILSLAGVFYVLFNISQPSFLVLSILGLILYLLEYYIFLIWGKYPNRSINPVLIVLAVLLIIFLYIAALTILPV